MLLDVERVAPCLPGAALDGGDGETFTGTMKIKLGPITSQYKGTVRIEEADETRAPRRPARRGAGRRGQGTAAATITTVDARGRRRHARVRRDRPARQRPGGAVRPRRDAGRLRQADAPVRRLPGRGDGRAPARRRRRPAATMRADGTAASPPPPSSATRTRASAGSRSAPPRTPPWPPRRATAPRPSRERRAAEVLDLGAASRGAVLKRVVPAGAAALAAITAIVVWRKSSS